MVNQSFANGVAAAVISSGAVRSEMNPGANEDERP